MLGLLLSSVVFDGMSCEVGYSLVFSWWLTAYFTRMLRISWRQLLIQLALIAITLLGIFIAGEYNFIYNDAPPEFSATFGIVMLTHAFIAISPGVFGKVTNIIEDRISIRVAA